MKWILIHLKHLPTFFWIKRGTLAFVGFILSPLSWWNDIFVNVPLAYAFAWLIGKFLDIFIDIERWLFVTLFIIGYFITNVAGFLMMHYSIFGIKKVEKNSIMGQILVSLFYTLVIVGLSYFDIFDLNIQLDIIPDWVIK
ncbi:MAG: hypothetical protein GF365_02185 [Candidatus Buchananbacteria bacterium]|nr:hypothetical protein [Candidatus Buchananbacteria bacterium]